MPPLKKKKKDIDEMHFAVDIPQIDKEEFICVEYFETRKDAIKFAQEKYGADSRGRISLVSQL